jgi:hypothetical protein
MGCNIFDMKNHLSIIPVIALTLFPAVCFATTVVVKDGEKETARWEEADGVEQVKIIDGKGNVLSLEKKSEVTDAASKDSQASSEIDKALFGGVCIGDDMRTAEVNLRKSGFEKINFQEELEFISLNTKINNTRLYVSFDFEDGQAWAVDFSTYRYDVDQYNKSIQRDWETLVKLIETRYGPAKHAKEYPSFLSVVNGSYETHRWILGEKIIYIKVEDDRATCAMFNRAINEKIGEQIKEKENSEINEAAKKLF